MISVNQITPGEVQFEDIGLAARLENSQVNIASRMGLPPGVRAIQQDGDRIEALLQ